MESKPIESGDSALLLGYAAKVERSLWETGARINVVLVTQSIISIAIMAVALGLSSYPSKLSVIGFRIGVSLPMLLCGGAITAACLLMYQLGLVHHEEQLLQSLLDIYTSVGLEHPSLSRFIAHPLENPGIVTTIVALSLKSGRAGLSFWATRTFTLVIFLGLPLFVQIVVAFVLVSSHLLPWAMPVSIAFAMSVWYLVLYFAAVDPSGSK